MPGTASDTRPTRHLQQAPALRHALKTARPLKPSHYVPNWIARDRWRRLGV